MMVSHYMASIVRVLPLAAKPTFSYNDRALLAWCTRHIHVETANIEIGHQVWPQITLEETKTALKKASRWKAPRKDGIANFWIKNLPALHQDRENAYNECLSNPEIRPDWLYLHSSSPREFKNNLYENNLLPIEQKGCRRGSYGCKDQSLINKAIFHRGNKKEEKKPINSLDRLQKGVCLCAP